MLFKILSLIDEIFWVYFAFLIIMVCGFFLTLRTRFFQLRAIPQVLKIFSSLIGQNCSKERGVHPLRAFFASVGGMIGVGNIAGIATAVQLGGPGALLWVWVAGMVGAIVKYSEIYLGCKFRVENKHGSYDGGPMYFLRKAFSFKWISIFVSILLCIYGVEIYQFSVITDSVSSNWHISRPLVIAVLLISILYAGLGGVKRIGLICSWIMPFFLVTYFLMGLWVIIQEASSLPSIFAVVFKSAFTGHAAIGGFAGSSVILAIQHGIGRAAYSADIGIGYDSIIQSESNSVHPERQARLAILGVALDNLICTFSVLIVLVSGVWKVSPALKGSELVQTALCQYFPFMEYFMPFFFIVTGYTTIIAYFVVGIKCARFLSPQKGKTLYVAYGILAFIFFSFVPQNQALVVMSICGALLLITNILGIFRLRHEIDFSLPESKNEKMEESTEVARTISTNS